MNAWILRLSNVQGQTIRFVNSLWFFPLLMAVSAVVLFALTSSLDGRLLTSGQAPPADIGGFLVFAGSPSAARSLLSAIATGWATILGVVFSVTLVTVQLTASQYTAQMLTQFEKAKTNQVVLGAFVGTVTYALLVLKTVRTGEDGGPTFVPVIGTNLAMLFAVADLLLLILFISNLISFVRPQRFVKSTTETTADSLEAVLAPREHDWLEARHATVAREAGNQENARPGRPHEIDQEGQMPSYEVRVERPGVIASVSWDTLLGGFRRRLLQAARRAPPGAQQLTWRLRLTKCLGQSVDVGETLGEIEAPLPGRELRRLGSWVRTAYLVRDERRPEGDPEYGIIMLREMGLRAVASTDSEAGVSVLQSLFALLARIVRLPPPAPTLVVHADEARLEVERPTVNLYDTTLAAISKVVDAALGQHVTAVVEAMGRESATLLARFAREGRRDDFERMATDLVPVYQRSLARLESACSLRAIIDSLVGAVETFCAEGRWDEARVLDEMLIRLAHGSRGSTLALGALRDAAVRLSHLEAEELRAPELRTAPLEPSQADGP